MSLEANKIYQTYGLTNSGMKIAEIIMTFEFDLHRKENDDRMFQMDVELESNRLFEENWRYQARKNREGNHTI